MKIRVGILNNPIYSEILYYINNREVYASDLAKELNKSQATIQKQLNILLNDKYLLIKDHPDKLKNIKLFSVNWKKITEEYYTFLYHTSKERLDVYEDYFKSKITDPELLKQYEDFYDPLKRLKVCKNLFVNNKILIKIFITAFQSFKVLGKIYHQIELNMLFTNFSVLFLRDDYKKELYRIYVTNKEEEDFMDYLSIVCLIVSQNLLVSHSFFNKYQFKE